MKKNRKPADQMRVVAEFEIPPPGYTGSLKGTGWDPDEVLETYNQ